MKMFMEYFVIIFILLFSFIRDYAFHVNLIVIII